MQFPSFKQLGPEPSNKDVLSALERFMGDLNMWQMKLDYDLGLLGSFRVVEKDREDNIDALYPITMQTYLPPNTRSVKVADLRLRLLSFRSYGRATQAVLPNRVSSDTLGASWHATQQDAGDPVGYGGDHSHSGFSDTAPNHSHTTSSGSTGLDGTHVHSLSIYTDGGHYHPITTHVHAFWVPDHWHELEAGIYEGPMAAGVGVSVNGVDVTSALGGPFDTDQDGLDLLPYLVRGQWNSITLSSTGLGRVAATLYMELYQGKPK